MSWLAGKWLTDPVNMSWSTSAAIASSSTPHTGASNTSTVPARRHDGKILSIHDVTPHGIPWLICRCRRWARCDRRPCRAGGGMGFWIWAWNEVEAKQVRWGYMGFGCGGAQGAGPLVWSRSCSSRTISNYRSLPKLIRRASLELLHCTSLYGQKAVNDYFSCKLLLLFGFGRQYT